MFHCNWSFFLLFLFCSFWSTICSVNFWENRVKMVEGKKKVLVIVFFVFIFFFLWRKTNSKLNIKINYSFFLSSLSFSLYVFCCFLFLFFDTNHNYSTLIHLSYLSHRIRFRIPTKNLPNGTISIIKPILWLIIQINSSWISCSFIFISKCNNK